MAWGTEAPLGLRTYTLRGPRAVPCIGLGYTCDLTVAIVWGITSLHNYQGITPGISRLTTLMHITLFIKPYRERASVAA